MVNEAVNTLLESRIIIGYLGEKHQSGWWQSSFLLPSSIAFLAPVFPKSTFTAQYQGVCQAALRVHDEYIGLGRHYHLYRLPDSIERALAKISQNATFTSKLSKKVKNRQIALNHLHDLCGTSRIDFLEGPIAVGNFSQKTLIDLIKKSLSYYLKAFETNSKSFPFMRMA